MSLALATLVLAQATTALPPGPAAEAWAAVDPGVEPADLAPWPAWALPAAGRDPWDREEPWRRWVELERAEGRDHDARRRGELALLALAQGRHDDAWGHFERCADDAAILAALLPRFLPGIGAGETPGPAGSPPRLPAGARLAPSLPPPLPAGVPPGEREMGLGELFVGATRLSMRVSLEPDGIQVDLVHLEGPTAEVTLVLPTPPGVRIGAVYVDWARREDVPAEVPVRVTADEPEHAVWGRFRRRAETWPEGVPQAFPARLRGGLEIVVGEDLGRGLGRALRFGEALSELLDVPVAFREPQERPGTAPPEPLTIHLLRPSELERKLAALVGRAERFTLP